MARAALFDLDRTLVRVETASLYVRYQREIGEANWRDSLRVAYWVLQYTLGILDAPKVAVKALSTLRGMSETAMSARCDDWVRRYVAKHVTDGAREAVHTHRKAGDLLAIVTGASPYTARPVARMLGIEHVVSSELAIENGHFTGQPDFPLCYGEGKLERAKRLAAAHDFRLDEAAFYTDSYTDLPLLLAVGEPLIVNPDPRLRREAERRKWPILSWLITTFIESL